MTNRVGQLRLGAFFHPTGNHIASWLHKGAAIDAGTNFEHYKQIALMAEEGKFDLIFLADALATRNGRLGALKRWPQYMAYFDPQTLMSGLAAVTRHIGLVSTATTSYNEPYHVARRYASLDHISHGRAGWNVVTSSNFSESKNFGREEHLLHDEKYDRAEEFVEVVKKLWDSWDDDAFIRDRKTAIYFDPEKIHEANHVGPNFKVKGPLNVARPPQGYPVIAQAGRSPEFMSLASKHAEVIFTAQHDVERANQFYEQMKSKLAEHGRERDDMKIMPGLNVVVAPTHKEAEDKYAYLQSLIHPDVGREVLSNELGNVDLSVIGPDEEVPISLIPEARRTTFERMKSLTGKAAPTLSDLYRAFGSARGQRPLVGTPHSIVDEMQAWFNAYAADGFLVHPSVLPEGLADFCDLIIPELQSRGLFRQDYEGQTLRENLGLARPVSQYAR